MTGIGRLLALPWLALVLVVGVLGVQLAHGGGSYEPLHPADPCRARHVTSQAKGIDGLTERLVLLGLDGAACRLHLSREALTLRLAQGRDPSQAEVDALHAGLLQAVQRLKAAHELPPASDLVDEALDSSDLNGIIKAVIKRLPDSVVNAALKTDDVLTRTIDNLDLRKLLANLDDEHELDAEVQAAVEPAVKDALVDRLKGLV